MLKMKNYVTLRFKFFFQLKIFVISIATLEFKVAVSLMFLIFLDFFRFKFLTFCTHKSSQSLKNLFNTKIVEAIFSIS